MGKRFTTDGACCLEDNYMVDLSCRLKKIRTMIDRGEYFAVIRPGQCGKTTMLRMLASFLRVSYYVVSLDLGDFSDRDFSDENSFASTFAHKFLSGLMAAGFLLTEAAREITDRMKSHTADMKESYGLRLLFSDISGLCGLSDKPVVLLTDGMDRASGSQVFFDFLSLLRAYYLRRKTKPIFRSVILAGTHEIRDLESKIPDRIRERRLNGPWNISADFDIDLSFAKEEIAKMLKEYEKDRNTGMDTDGISEMIFEYTSGYPFLVSGLCQILDEKPIMPGTKSAWTKEGVLKAVNILAGEDNILFAGLAKTTEDYPEADKIMRGILFSGYNIPFNTDDKAIGIAAGAGLIRNINGYAAAGNKIFEIRFRNKFLRGDD